jgi:signal transduction histidine kinase
MDQSSARRDAIRVFRLLLLFQLLFLGLTIIAALAFFRGPVGPALLLRAAPLLILALLFLPPWLEKPLGKYFLAAGLGLEILFASLESITRAAGLPEAVLTQAGVPPGLIDTLAMAPAVEPFLFVIIPLVLLAWGYGRQGALLGSTWAAILHLYLGLWTWPPGENPVAFLAPASMRITLLYLVPFLVSVLAERQRTQHAELEAAHQRLRRHAATVEQLAVSRERNRMARDLHDTLAHSLSALIVQLEALRTLVKHDPGATVGALDEVTEVARHGLEESRQAIQALRTGPVEELGLTGALRDRLRALQERTGIHADLRVAGQARDLTDQEVDTLFRIAEEALANVERHSQAQNVRVRLEYAANRTELTVIDDGLGFDPEGVDPDRYGLAGMQERAGMIDAELVVSSNPGGGTRVWCSLKR